MAESKTPLRVEMVTPVGAIADVETDAVTAPGKLGEFEVLAGHVPFLTELHAGVLTLGETQTVERYAVGPGFLEVTADALVRVLVERAVPATTIDKAAAQAEVDETSSALESWKQDLDGEYRTLKARHEWASAQLAAAALV